MKHGKIMSAIDGIFTWADKHQREIFLGTQIAGTVITAVLCYKAGTKAEDIIAKHKEKMDEIDIEDKEGRKKETVETVKDLAPIFVPPIVTGAMTIGCAIGGYKASSKQIAALSAAYALSEKALNEYTSKATELLGKKKAQDIQDAVNVDKLKNADLAPSNSNFISTGTGYNVPCYDVHSGRYFYSSAERIRQACNTINKRLMDEYYISLNELYDELGLPAITLGEDMGFTVDNGLIDIDRLFTATPYEINGATVPVLVFNVDAYLTTKYMEHRGGMFR